MKNKKDIKLSLYNNIKIVIENYNKLIDLSDNEIDIDNYRIIGSGLKIKTIDEYYIIIVGEINTIEVVRE